MSLDLRGSIQDRRRSDKRWSGPCDCLGPAAGHCPAAAFQPQSGLNRRGMNDTAGSGEPRLSARPRRAQPRPTRPAAARSSCEPLQLLAALCRCATAAAPFAALAALVVAALATLAVPIAVRRMIDFGFSAEGVELIDSYFAVMIAVVAVLAVASALRYYLVTTLGERIVADLRERRVRPSHRAVAAPSSTRRRPARCSRGSPPTPRRSSPRSAPRCRSRCAISCCSSAPPP